jgi:predicted phage terminase large subunit-like protein
MADKRKKPDKDQRIESISGYFERGNVFFNAAESNNHHMKRLKEQLLAFQPGVKSPKDGPDALEGAMFLLIQNNITADNWIVGRATDNNRL